MLDKITNDSNEDLGRSLARAKTVHLLRKKSKSCVSSSDPTVCWDIYPLLLVLQVPGTVPVRTNRTCTVPVLHRVPPDQLRTVQRVGIVVLVWLSVGHPTKIGGYSILLNDVK